MDREGTLFVTCIPMFRLLLYVFLIYLAYQFIFRFIIPVYKTTQRVKKGFREMRDHMNDSANQQSSSQQTQSANDPSKEKIGEYIDFEEIK
jgi:hypothetical protein